MAKPDKFAICGEGKNAANTTQPFQKIKKGKQKERLVVSMGVTRIIARSS